MDLQQFIFQNGMNNTIQNMEQFKKHIMFLSKQWIENLEKYGYKDDNSGWVKLKNYLLEKNLEHSLYGRKRSIFEIFNSEWNKSKKIQLLL